MSASEPALPSGDLVSWQQDFVSALGRPDVWLVGIEAAHQQRLDVYRNNVWASLIAALEEAYPVTRQVVGERFFAALAHDHAHQHLPESPLMMHYGRGLDETLQSTLAILVANGQALAQQLPFYAVDLARLEAARLEAYHAADAEPLAPAELASLAPESLMELRFTAHPAARLLQLDHAVLEIWQRHQQPQATLSGLDVERPQALLITRPVLEVQVLTISAASVVLLKALMRGDTLADAAENLAQQYPEEDLGVLLAPVLSSGALLSLADHPTCLTD